MKNLENLEKIINSELTSKVKSSKIKHNQIYLNIEESELINVTMFLKNNGNLSNNRFIIDFNKCV